MTPPLNIMFDNSSDVHVIPKVGGVAVIVAPDGNPYTAPDGSLQEPLRVRLVLAPSRNSAGILVDPIPMEIIS